MVVTEVVTEVKLRNGRVSGQCPFSQRLYTPSLSMYVVRCALYVARSTCSTLYVESIRVVRCM